MAEPDKDVPGVIALPPLIFAGFLVVGLALDWLLWPLGHLATGRWHYAVGAVLILGGIAVGLLGERRLHRAGTNVSPYKPSTTIVSGGIYAYTRNPLYLALALILAGAALLANGIWTLAMVLPFLLVIRYGVIAREEAYLERKFGDIYGDYKARVRRWL
jgi:protein-S-isoprenylcysteine O-methyltransferase Ste14